MTYVGNVGKALCAKQPNSRFFCKIPYPSGHHSHPTAPTSGRGGAAFLFLSLWKETGSKAPVAVRGWVPIEVQNLAVLSTGHARGLRPCGSRDPPAAFEGSGCALVLGRKEGGLIIAACGLGGPHYARKQQPHARSPPSPPIPLLPPAGEGGPRFYFLRGDLCWKRGESTLCETAQQPVLLQDPLPAAACRVERLDPRSDVIPMVVVGPTRKHVLVDHARFIDIDPAADL